MTNMPSIDDSNMVLSLFSLSLSATTAFLCSSASSIDCRAKPLSPARLSSRLIILSLNSPASPEYTLMLPNTEPLMKSGKAAQPLSPKRIAPSIHGSASSHLSISGHTTCFPVPPVRPFSLVITELALYGRDEPEEPVLQDVVVGACLHGRYGKVLSHEAGDDYNGQIKPCLPYGLDHVEAAYLRHHIVRDDEVPALLEGFPQGVPVIYPQEDNLVHAAPELVPEED